MISIGQNIKDGQATLTKAPVKYLVNAIRHPQPQIEAKIRQLRIVRQLNPAQYRELKCQLPYFVCGMFNPPQRKVANFAYTEYFIVDIDHIADKELDLATLRSRLSADSRVMLCFASPSGDGLKVLFRLSERCYDAGLYKVFYQLFVRQFSSLYGLDQVVDTRTCDVARACFISIDSEAYYNEAAEAVCIKDFVNDEDHAGEALRLKSRLDEEAKAQPAPPAPPREKQQIDDSALDLIRKTLNPDARPRKTARAVYVPKELDAIMDALRAYVTDKGVELTEVINISYGKKLRFKLQNRQAEINLFFGKRGFTVVQSPRSGTNEALNSLMAEVIENFICENT